MATTACTSYYTTVLVGYVPGSGTTTGNVVTFKTPKPVWTDDNSVNALQCNAVTIGGVNGLNS
jgi:hypothetical protein